MVLTAGRRAGVPTLVVPDEQTWTLLGAEDGLHPVFAPADARRLLVPERLPAALAAALGARVAELPQRVEIDRRPLRDFPGEPVAAVLDAAHRGHAEQGGRDAHAGHREHAGHDGRGDHVGYDGHGEDDEHAGHGMHDHGDMMAIVGEPSADGLVMEPIELRYGPLGTPLPGGLAVGVTLDGDVVAEANVQALLSTSAAPPDPLAPAAWDAAIAGARQAPPAAETAWLRLAAVELERAVSHLAWLRSLGRLLGWQPLVDRCSAALAILAPIRRRALPEASDPVHGQGADIDPIIPSADLDRARAAVDAVVSGVTRSRLLRMRTAGRGSLTADEVRARGLRGPVARASGVADDARAGYPLYERLGFEPLVRSGGDALARTLLRAQEARRALDLAAAALGSGFDGQRRKAAERDSEGATVEGPRGPVRAWLDDGRLGIEAPGEAAAREAAGAAMVGLEWSAALVTLASFDLSPWTVQA